MENNNLDSILEQIGKNLWDFINAKVDEATKLASLQSIMAIKTLPPDKAVRLIQETYNVSDNEIADYCNKCNEIKERGL